MEQQPDRTPGSLAGVLPEIDFTLLELADRLLHRGVVLVGEATISVAGVDLIYLGLNVVLTAVENLRSLRLPSNELAAHGSGPHPRGGLARPPALEGLRQLAPPLCDGRPCWIAAGSLVVVASEWATKTELGREEMLAQHRVVEALCAEGDWLPVRFGSWVEDEEAARALLRAREPALLAALARVRGRRGWR